MCRDIFICEEVSWLWLSDCDWDAMLELDSMRCRIGGSSNAKMKYHYSVRSSLSVGSLHDLQRNKGGSRRFRSSHHIPRKLHLGESNNFGTVPSVTQKKL